MNNLFRIKKSRQRTTWQHVSSTYPSWCIEMYSKQFDISQWTTKQMSIPRCMRNEKCSQKCLRKCPQKCPVQCRIQRWMQSNDSHNWCTPTRNTVAFKVIKIWINANKKFSVSDIDVELFAVSWHCQWITWWRRSCVSAYKSIEMPFPYCQAHVIHSHYRLHHQCHQSTA